MIVSKCNGDRENLLNELNKIQLYCKGGKKITSENIAKITNLIENHSISELVDNCLAKNKNKSEFEHLILDIAFIEYVRQILNGIPMSQTEFIKVNDYKSIKPSDLHPINKNLTENFSVNEIANLKERLVKIAVQKETTTTLENTQLDLEFEQIREQFQKFNALNVNNDANQWHLKDELIPREVINELSKLGVLV